MFSKNKTTYNASTKTWSGVKTAHQYGPESSIGQIVLEKLMGDPENIAQICHHNGKQYTSREIATLSIRIAQHFKCLPVQQCDIIGLCASNSDFVAPLFFGAMLCGLTVSTLDTSFDKDGIKHIYSITKPKIMFCDGGIYKTVKEALEEINLEAVIYTMKDHIEGVPNITEFLRETGCEQDFKIVPLKLGYAQTAAILCSSGTTGLPKGVCMSHASLLNAFSVKSYREQRVLCFSTLYWFSGLSCLLFGTVSGATRVINDKAFTPEHFCDIVEKHKVTIVTAPPSQIAMAVATPKIKGADLSSVALFVCGGSALPYILIERIRPFMPQATFVFNYALSETIALVSYGPPTPTGAAGQLTKNTVCKVIDEHGQFLGPGQQGEICICSKFPWAGYYDNAQATADTYRNGWIHSGDLGYFDAQGNLFIVDRKKDILKYCNFHYFPTEIETVLLEMPEVAEVCVCGIDDLTMTTLPAAAIVRTPGCALSEEVVKQYVAERVAHFKQLRGGVYFMEALPKTVSGKYLRQKVKELCEQQRRAK